ncbi:YceI family protein [Crocinitomix catalasitica]|uniref:YceI family protein n=1 Tax=Crocinitomix catalasitica TaxID=184607 RepID=UPI0004803DBB|nr:YceI family protein [Crocinitomix catalasitica]
MKNIILSIAFLLPLLGFSQSLKIKSNLVKVTFVADMQNTSGSIGGFEAKINFDKNDLTKSTISGSVDVSTLDTGTKKRDEHLKSEDYFNAAKYPKMTFTSTSIVEKDNQLIMTGKLKIKETVREEVVIFTFSDNVFTGTMKINATDYEMGNFSKKKPEKTNIKIKFEIPVGE